MRYFPNPAHKLETTEAGPPRWWPDKEPCPRMSPQERDVLLRDSVALDPESETSRRYAVHRGDSGLEFFEAKCTRVVEGDPEYHGHPTSRVPSKVLRIFRDRGLITTPEYRRAVRQLD